MSQEVEKDDKDDKEVKKPRSRAGLRRIIIGFLTLVIPFLLLGGFLAYEYMSFTGATPRGMQEEKEIIIMPGTNFQQVAELLYTENVITDVRRFIMYARYQDVAHKIRSGRFTMNTKWTPAEVLNHLMTALPTLETFSFPEGLPWWEVAKRFEEAGLIRFVDFENIIHDPAFLQYWSIPFKSAEGFLFPDTYKMLRPLSLNEQTAKGLIGTLINNFWKRTIHLWPDGKRPGVADAERVRRIVTLGSIIEKETAHPAELTRVSGVFANRINKNMRLQADPTIIYGLGPSFNGNITRADIQDAENLYNTYRINGLPPGPICSPGLGALEAARRPERHDYLYFVARGDGMHHFSADLNEHNRAVNLYQKKRRGDSLQLLPQ